jgi:hypothetical protein
MENVIKIAAIDRTYHVAYLIVNESQLNPIKVVRALESITVEHHDILLVKHFFRIDHLRYYAFQIKS